MPYVPTSNYGGLIKERSSVVDPSIIGNGVVIDNDSFNKREESVIQFKDKDGVDQAVGMSWFEEPEKKERIRCVIKERYGDKFVPPGIICGIAKELEISDGINHAPEGVIEKPKEIPSSFADSVGLNFGNWSVDTKPAKVSDWGPPVVTEEDMNDWF